LTVAVLYACVYAAGVDAVAALLEGPRARGAFLLRSSLDPPWCLRIQDEAPLTVVAVVRGHAWLQAGTEPARLEQGDLAVLRGPDPYELADRPGRSPTAVVHPGQHCTTLSGRPLVDLAAQGVRSWGNSPDGSTQLLTGTYQLRSAVSRRLLAALPAQLHIAAEGGDPLVPYLAEQIQRDAPGQEAVLDRLLDLLLASAIRTWLSGPAERTPGWVRAQGDPVVGPAVRLMHDDPAHPWTVALLARRTGVARATFARRFGEVVGEPPMAFLTSWRLTLAADLLREPGATVDAVARQVGYGTGFALSTAFKRVRGVTPSEHRLSA